MGKRNRKRARTGHGGPKGASGRGRFTAPGGSGGTGRAGGPGGPGRSTPGRSDRTRAVGIDELSRIEETFLDALKWTACAEGDRAERSLDLLACWWADGVGRADGMALGAVPFLVSRYLVGALDAAWQRGWQPADLHRVVRRRLTAGHVRLVVQAMAEQAEEYRHLRPSLRRWMDQLDEVGAVVTWGPADDHLLALAGESRLDRRELLRRAMELLELVHLLPDLPRLCPPPSDWGHSAAVAASLDRRDLDDEVDIRYLERIRALLAKAESTEFDEEAASFTAKAHELMTRHAIDAALLEAHAAGRQAGAQPTAIRIGIDDPYAQAKSGLLAVIAEATRCQSVWSKGLGFSTVFGYVGDLRAVELLYTSLLLQANSAMTRAGQRDRGARRRGFRQSFLIAFAIRIGDRLEEAAESTLAGAEAEVGGAFLPVLAERMQKVEELRDDCFSALTGIRASAGDPAGWASGTRAADEAQLSFGAPVEQRASA